MNGIDLDNEASETPGDSFVEVIRELRKALGTDTLIEVLK